MQIQFQGFQPNQVNMGCNWNRNVMQKKRQLIMEENSQKELDTLKGSISSEAQELRMKRKMQNNLKKMRRIVMQKNYQR